MLEHFLSKKNIKRKKKEKNLSLDEYQQRKKRN